MSAEPPAETEAERAAARALSDLRFRALIHHSHDLVSIYDASGTFVYVIGSDATVTPRPVTLDATQGDLVVIARGLEEGERVVVDGQNQLRPGSRVSPREPGKAPGGKIASDGADAARGGAPAR